MSADGIKRSLRASVRATFEEAGPEIRDEIRQRVGVPVQHVKGGVIRSKEGEAPRRDKGGYQAAWKHHIDESEKGEPTLVVENDSGIGPFLENGTETMRPRPHARPAFVDWVRRLPNRLMVRLRSDFNR